MGLIEVHSTNGKPGNGGSNPETAQGIGSREPKTERDVYRPELGTQGIEEHGLKKVIKVVERRDLVEDAIAAHQMSERQACATLPVCLKTTVICPLSNGTKIGFFTKKCPLCL
jgi:hypothetical protein